MVAARRTTALRWTWLVVVNARTAGAVTAKESAARESFMVGFFLGCWIVTTGTVIQQIFFVSRGSRLCVLACAKDIQIEVGAKPEEATRP